MKEVRWLLKYNFGKNDDILKLLTQFDATFRTFQKLFFGILGFSIRKCL